MTPAMLLGLEGPKRAHQVRTLTQLLDRILRGVNQAFRTKHGNLWRPCCVLALILIHPRVLRPYCRCC